MNNVAKIVLLQIQKAILSLKKNVSSISSLIIYNNDMPIDTIKTVWSQHGEKLNYSFIEGKNDTLFIDVK
ncbi:hypothetical protein Q1W71_22840 [Flavobacterium pectinovorum]|uniref:hypothetical protein n=1 Tax=Flavobacterium pectinovorum TaxID=29533 RepID=UPI00265F1278|nr:hypothetical protein [Flavobacterium pectinovorum]WKL47771.1 hypothetical protein Q1W71_22840 [Flavobacterium pectinovorum]